MLTGGIVSSEEVAAENETKPKVQVSVHGNTDFYGRWETLPDALEGAEKASARLRTAGLDADIERMTAKVMTDFYYAVKERPNLHFILQASDNKVSLAERVNTLASESYGWQFKNTNAAEREELRRLRGAICSLLLPKEHPQLQKNLAGIDLRKEWTYGDKYSNLAILGGTLGDYWLVPTSFVLGIWATGCEYIAKDSIAKALFALVPIAAGVGLVLSSIHAAYKIPQTVKQRRSNYLVARRDFLAAATKADAFLRQYPASQYIDLD